MSLAKNIAKACSNWDRSAKCSLPNSCPKAYLQSQTSPEQFGEAYRIVCDVGGEDDGLAESGALKRLVGEAIGTEKVIQLFPLFQLLRFLENIGTADEESSGTLGASR